MGIRPSPGPPDGVGLSPPGRCSFATFIPRRSPGPDVTDGEESHASPRIVVSFNEGGHPTGAEMVAATILFFVGVTMIYLWVATFYWQWATGAILFLFGGILFFHDKPLLRPRKRSTDPR